MIIALFEPDIPQNTGSIIRLCACMHIPLHIIGPCGFPFNDQKMRRAALDYYDLVSMTRHSSWQQFLNSKQGRLVLLTTRAQQYHTEFAFQTNDILLFGRESCGVPQEVREVADTQVKIPLYPGARSLNIAQAASMVLGEALRQTNNFPKGQS